MGQLVTSHPRRAGASPREPRLGHKGGLETIIIKRVLEDRGCSYFTGNVPINSRCFYVVLVRNVRLAFGSDKQ